MAGIVKRLSRCTPIDKPIRKNISTIHLSAPGSSAVCSHFKIAQNTIAVKNELIAYTSPSTALNQNESVKVYAKAPMMPAPIIPTSCRLVSSLLFLRSPKAIRRAKCVIVQNKNKMVKPLASALITFTALAAVIGLSPNNTINTLPINTNSGAPGGWGICNLKQLLTNSPQSHRLPPASLVII